MSLLYTFYGQFAKIMAMFGIFKEEEKKPISFASVEMQKAPRNYFKWIIGTLVIISVFIVDSCISSRID